MTTPVVYKADPTTLPVGSQLVQICPELGPGTTVLIYNNDITNVAYAGFRQSGLTPSNSTPIQPLASVVVAGDRVIYGFCPTATVSLTIVPGGTNISPSPAQIQQQINTLGLATQASQQSQINQMSSMINQLGLYSQTANPFFTDAVTGNAAAPNLGVVGASSASPAGIGAVTALPVGSGYPNGLLVTPVGGQTICRISQAAGFPCAPGEIPTGHVLLYTQTSVAGTVAYLAFNFYDVNGTLVGVTPVLTPNFQAAGIWQKFVYPVNNNAAAPANTVRAVFYVGLQNAGNIPNTQLFNVASYCAYNSNNTTVPGDLSQALKLLTGALSGALIANTGLTIGQEVAALIGAGSSTGQAGGLYHGAKQIVSQGVSVAAGGTQTLGPFTMTKPGYLINFRPQYTTTNGAIPFCQIDLVWLNNTTIDLGQHIRWVLPVLGGPAGTNYSPTLGQGPTRGLQLKIVITNLDPAQAITPFIDLWECTHHIARDDWRSDQNTAFIAPPGFTIPPGTIPTANILMSEVSPALGNGATSSFILPTYAGQAFLTIVTSGPAGGLPIVQILPQSIAGVLAAPAYIFNYQPAGPSNFLFSQIITLPRYPCILSRGNGGTAGQIIDTQLTAMEFVS